MNIPTNRFRSLNRAMLLLPCLLVLCLSTPLLAQEEKPLTLAEAIRLGLENNYGIQIKKKSTQAASVRNSWSMAGAIPTFTLDGSVNGSREIVSDVNTGTLSATAKIEWKLFDGFNIQASKDLFANQEEEAKGSEMMQVESTIQSIINSYYFVLLQQKMLKTSQTVMDISADRLLQQQTAKDVGASGTYEYILAENYYLNDKNTYLKQKMILREALRSLNLLLSLPIETRWTLTDEISIPQHEYQIEQMKQLLLSDNRTLKNQYINLRAKEIEIKKQRSHYFPSIDLSASFNVLANDNNISESTHSFRPRIELSISYTLFNGGRTRRNVNIARINKEMEQIATEEMELSLEKELMKQYDEYLLQSDLVAINKEQVRIAKIILDLSAERLKSGVINSFNYRETQINYLRSATTLQSSTFNLIATNIELLRLTGGILSFEQ